MSISVQKSKRTMHVKMITFGILLHAVASITEDSLIIWDEFISDEDSVLTNYQRICQQMLQVMYQ